MNSIVVEPHYLGSLEYFALLAQQEEVVLEINDRFRKQTFRNRAYFLLSNKVQPLILPLSYSNHDLTKDVRIDHSQRWLKDHWGAFYSSYGKSPYYEHFSEMFESVWNKRHKFLPDLLVDFLELAIRLLRIDIKLRLTEKYEDLVSNDFRDRILPKKSFSDRKIYLPVQYAQLFGDTFVPNLSIVDLIMCEGSQSGQILNRSFLRE